MCSVRKERVWLISRGPVSRTRPRSARVPVDNTLLRQPRYLSPRPSTPILLLRLLSLAAFFLSIPLRFFSTAVWYLSSIRWKKNTLSLRRSSSIPPRFAPSRSSGRPLFALSPPMSLSVPRFSLPFLLSFDLRFHSHPRLFPLSLSTYLLPSVYLSFLLSVLVQSFPLCPAPKLEESWSCYNPESADGRPMYGSLFYAGCAALRCTPRRTRSALRLADPSVALGSKQARYIRRDAARRRYARF